MGGAFFWGLVAASSLIVGSAFALRFRISQRNLGLVMGFRLRGAHQRGRVRARARGVRDVVPHWHVAAGLFAGSFTFFVGDALIALGVLAAFLQLALNGDNPTGVVALFEVALLVATVVVIAVGVVDPHDVNAQSIFGAVSIYVLIGMLFVFVYSAAAALGSGPFFAQGTDGTLSTRLYFSYVTLATPGYGDYTAAGDFGRTVSVIEAMLGQI
jgi:hypothetical protein